VSALIARFLAQLIVENRLEGDMDSPEQLQRRVLALEAQSRHQRAAFIVLSGLLAASIWMPRSQAQQQSDALRVRSLIVEDASGQPRVVLGAPLPGDARTSNLRTGIRINDPKGVERMGLTINEQGVMGMGFDAPPGTGDDRNRERFNIVADEKGGVAIRMKDRRTYVVSSWYLDDQNRAWLEFSDYSQQSTIRRRVGLKGEETITGTR
jgi:hypothetical protein